MAWTNLSECNVISVERDGIVSAAANTTPDNNAPLTAGGESSKPRQKQHTLRVDERIIHY